MSVTSGSDLMKSWIRPTRVAGLKLRWTGWLQACSPSLEMDPLWNQSHRSRGPDGEKNTVVLSIYWPKATISGHGEWQVHIHTVLSSPGRQWWTADWGARWLFPPPASSRPSCAHPGLCHKSSTCWTCPYFDSWCQVTFGRLENNNMGMINWWIMYLENVQRNRWQRRALLHTFLQLSVHPFSMLLMPTRV